MPILLWSNAKVVAVPSSKGTSKGPTGKFWPTLGMFIIWVTPGGTNFISMWCCQWVLDQQPCAAVFDLVRSLFLAFSISCEKPLRQVMFLNLFRLKTMLPGGWNSCLYTMGCQWFLGRTGPSQMLVSSDWLVGLNLFKDDTSFRTY